MTAVEDAPALTTASAPDWELPANRGWHRLHGRLLGTLDRESNPSFLAELQLRGEFWSVPEAINAPDVVPDYTVTLHQMELPQVRLEHARASLEAWLSNYRPVDFELSVGEESRHLRCQIEPDSDTISSSTHPVARFHFAAPSLTGGVRFVVDQSCIRIWLEGLSAWSKPGAV